MNCNCSCHLSGKAFCEACWTEHDLDEEEDYTYAHTKSMSSQKTIRIYKVTLAEVTNSKYFVN